MQPLNDLRLFRSALRWHRQQHAADIAVLGQLLQPGRRIDRQPHQSHALQGFIVIHKGYGGNFIMGLQGLGQLGPGIACPIDQYMARGACRAVDGQHQLIQHRPGQHHEGEIAQRKDHMGAKGHLWSKSRAQKRLNQACSHRNDSRLAQRMAFVRQKLHPGHPKPERYSTGGQQDIGQDRQRLAQKIRRFLRQGLHQIGEIKRHRQQSQISGQKDVGLLGAR